MTEAGLAASLALAFNRIEDFVAVQQPFSAGDLEPVLCLQQAVGIGDDERVVLRERIRGVAGGDHFGAVALGVLIGLFTAQLAGQGAVEG